MGKRARHALCHKLLGQGVEGEVMPVELPKEGQCLAVNRLVRVEPMLIYLRLAGPPAREAVTRETDAERLLQEGLVDGVAQVIGEEHDVKPFEDAFGEGKILLVHGAAAVVPVAVC